MQTYAILAQIEKDQKMEAEFQDLRREQEQELRELDKTRQEMESAIEEELKGTRQVRWRVCQDSDKPRLS